MNNILPYNRKRRSIYIVKKTIDFDILNDNIYRIQTKNILFRLHINSPITILQNI